MREIKLRCWDNGIMMYRNAFDLNWYSTPHNTDSGCNTIRKMIPSDRTLPIMLFIDRQDEKGIDIYDGDKLRYTAQDDNDYDHCVVCWDDDISAFVLNAYGCDMSIGEGSQEVWDDKLSCIDVFGIDQETIKGMVVIGNIHDTPCT